MSHRLEKLRQRLAENELDAILISQGENRRYLSGFTGSAGFLLISQKSAILATDFRYVEQAQSQAAAFDIAQIEGELPKWFPDLASSLGAKRIG
ncbi:MAG: aminopeptidase P family N-terminal domain-containing protein, partial [Dehalococcoidia bacterium]